MSTFLRRKEEKEKDSNLVPAQISTFLRRRTWRAIRSFCGVDTLTLATTDSAARRAGAGTEGKEMRRLPDTDAANEWAPASAGEASMAPFAPLLFTWLSLSPAQRRLRYGLILSVARLLKDWPNYNKDPSVLVISEQNKYSGRRKKEKIDSFGQYISNQTKSVKFKKKLLAPCRKTRISSFHSWLTRVYLAYVVI